MTIRLFKHNANSTCQYWRVRRQIDGVLYQRYVRIRPGQKQIALKRAQKISDYFDQIATATRCRKALTGQNVIRPNGLIVGLQRQQRERGNRIADEFKIRVKLKGNPPVFKCVSIRAHGFDTAFNKAVVIICSLRGIEPNTTAHKAMLNAKPLYTSQSQPQPTTDFTALEARLKKELQAFSRNDCIRG